MSATASGPLGMRGTVVAAFLFVLAWGPPEGYGAQNSAPQPATSQLEAANPQELVQAYVQLQEQLRATQLAIEHSRQETKDAAVQSAEALSNGLQAIQQAVSIQRAEDWQAIQTSNRVMLIVVGTFAALGCLTMLIMSYFQWRMSKGLADISAALPLALGLEPDAGVAAFAPIRQPSLRPPRPMRTPTEHSHRPEQAAPVAVANREAAIAPVEARLFPVPVALLRRRQSRALRVAVIVGMICAAVLALVFYVVTYRKLGFGYLRSLFPI